MLKERIDNIENIGYSGKQGVRYGLDQTITGDSYKVTYIMRFNTNE